jgi:regulatory protein
MKILKYKKDKQNVYKVETNKGEYKLYDDIIIKNELLLKKEISDKKWQEIIKENNKLKAYYDAIKSISIKMRTECEIENILKKKEYTEDEINETIKKLKEGKYINHEVYIEAYIHDHLALYIEGEKKIEKDLLKLGMTKKEISPYLEKIDKFIYQNKIKKYIEKKLKTNKKSKNEFKRKILSELINKGFNQEDINTYLDNIKVEENTDEIKRIINKLYQKYIKKYDYNTTILKIKNSLYQKGYTSIDIEKYLDKIV